MWIALVVVIAALTGSGVYLLSVRSLRGVAHPAASTEHAGPGAAPYTAPERRRFFRRPKTDDPSQWKGEQPKSERAPGTYIYVPLSIDEPPDVVTRLAKLLVLLALVSVSGLLIALGLWQLGQMIVRTSLNYVGG